jgi:tetratricopeptide (TPR) repeat protein
MTMRLDIVTNDAGELVRREHARELGAGVVVAVYRLAKLAQMHDLGNQAFVRQLEQTHQSIGEYCLRAGTNVNVLFAHKAVFLAGQLLKGSRTTYEAAADLATILAWCGGSELSIARDVTQSELLAFAEGISAAMRGEKGKGFKSPSPRIKLRAVADVALKRGIDVERLGVDQRIVRTYATAVVILRRFFDDLAGSKYVLPRRIKRVAQSLVDLSEGNTPAFLGVTESRNANHDAAGRAVNSAILAVAMARELTTDRAALSHVAMATMMYDVGRPRAAALSSVGGPRMTQVSARLTAEAEDELPSGTAAVLTALGRVNEPSITRTVIAYEALWLRRLGSLGPPYRGARAATLHARIVTMARRYNDLLTPEPGLPPPAPTVAIAELDAAIVEPADRTVLRMMVAALGLYPVGTVVQLTTGEVGEVVAGGTPSKPRVRVAMDARGGVLAAPQEVDLSRAGEARAVTRVRSIDGWKKGLDPARGAPRPSEPSSPSRSAVVATEPRVPVAAPVPEVVIPTGVETIPPPRGARTEPAVPAAIMPSPVISVGPPAPDPHAAITTPPPAQQQHQEQQEHEAPSDSFSGVSAGTSPSQVAEAMGRMIEEALRGPPARAPSPPPPPPPEPEPRPRHAARTAPPPRDWGITEPPPKPAEAPSTLADMKAARPVTFPPEGDADLVPSARGTLGATPLAHVLVYMLDRALTGSIVFREPASSEGGASLSHVFHFQNGAVSKVQIARPSPRIGDELVAAGLVSRAEVNEAVEGARRLGVLLGEYLVGHDKLGREALSRTLEAQLASRVAAIVNLSPETTYSYYRDVDLLAAQESEGVVSDPLNVILATVRSWNDRARIRATLARIAKHPLVFHAQSDPTHLALTAQERKVIEHVLQSKPTATALFQKRVGDDEVVSSLLYSLAVTRQFAFKGQKGAPMGGKGAAIPISIAPPAPSESVGSVPVMPPQSRAPIDFEDPGRESALPPEPPSVINDAFARATRTARPPAALSERPSPISVGRTSSEVSNAEGQLEAMTHFRLAEAALQRGELAQAERLAARAVSTDPEQVDYAALHIWIRATIAGDDDSAIEGIQALTRFLAKESDNERALLLRAKLMKQVGRVREAQRDFERVITMNPRSKDAAAELKSMKGRR